MKLFAGLKGSANEKDNHDFREDESSALLQAEESSSQQDSRKAGFRYDLQIAPAIDSVMKEGNSASWRPTLSWTSHALQSYL